MGLVVPFRWPDEMTERTPLPATARQPYVGRRVRAVREAMGLKQVQVCRSLGLAANLYSQWESGESRPNLDDMIRFCERYGIGLDWVYRGDQSRLPADIADKVVRLVAEYEREAAA